MEAPALDPRPSRAAVEGSPEIGAAATGLGLEPAFQPIVSLPDEAIVGFEALARWPSLHDPNPLAVFAHATAAGTLDQLDRLCVDAAISAALHAGMGSSTLLAINAEPASVYVPRARDAVLARGHDELTLMFELTERGLLAHPHALLAKVAALRADGFAIALDDVGAHPDSLALLDVLAPEIVKLDLHLVQAQPRRDQARTLAAVLAHHERTGAVILAEGIENDEHLEQALALGARLGQGYKFGRPGPLGTHLATGWAPARRPPHRRLATGSPFDLLTSSASLRTARKETLTAFSRHIESQADHTADPPMVLTALQQAEYFTPATRRRYLDLARSSPLVAIFGERLPQDLGPGIRGVALNPADPLCTEWTVLALGAQTAAALIARECTDPLNQRRPDKDRLFEFTITYDRPLVTAAAHNLLDRIP